MTVAVAATNMIESAATLAKRDGDYQRHNIDAALTHISGSTNTLAALQSGQVQLVLTTTEAAMLAQARGLPLLAIAGLNSGSTSSLILSKKYLASHPVPSDNSIVGRAAMLRDANFGVVSSTDETNLRYLFDLAKIPKSSLKEVKMQSQPAQVAALGQNEVDGILLSAPESFEAEAQGSGKIILNMRELQNFSQVPYIVAVTMRSYAKDHPDNVKSALAAIEEASAKMAKIDPDVVAFERGIYPKYSADVIQKSLNLIHMSPYQPLTEAEWQIDGQVLLSSGQLKSAFVPKEGTDWTNEYLPAKPS